MHGPFRPHQRRARVPRVARGEDRVGLHQSLVVAGVGHGHRRAGLDGVAGQPRGRGQAALERSRL